MHDDNFKAVEEMEQDIDMANGGKPQLKEYEKLLLDEANRETVLKANNLINAGCFEQKQENTFDYGMYEEVKAPKKYRGLYTLYRNLDTMQLVYVLPLVENNKGDSDERKDLAPYGYDCIYIEVMDEETYQMVMKAAKNNIKLSVDKWYFAARIVYVVIMVLSLIAFVFSCMNVSEGAEGFGNQVFFLFYYAGIYICTSAIATLLRVLIAVQYHKYKDK